MKVWITKYALTRGILQGVLAAADDGRPTNSIRVPSLSFHANFYKDEWHTTYEAAQAKALAMIAAKRKSIAKTLAELDKLEQELNKGQNND